MANLLPPETEITTDDGYTQTRYGLIRRRAHLVAEIETLHREVSRLTADLRAIEGAIKVLEPEIEVDDLPQRRVPPRYAAFRGEMARFFLTALRTRPDGMTTRELTDAIMEARYLDTKDASAVALIQRRTGGSLKKLRDKGFVRSEKAADTGLLRWWLVDGDVMAASAGAWRR